MSTDFLRSAVSQGAFSETPPSGSSSSARPLSQTSITHRWFALGITEHQRLFSVREISLKFCVETDDCAGLGWSYSCDAFSLGCILVELYTGVALFQTHDNLEHLAMMEKVTSKMPGRLCKQGQRYKPKYFTTTKSAVKLNFPNRSVSAQSKKEVKEVKSLHVSLFLLVLNTLLNLHLSKSFRTPTRLTKISSISFKGCSIRTPIPGLPFAML
jgi:hypothetical protein